MMAHKFQHEMLYRGGEALAKLAGLRLTVCGAGALGSNLCDNLARQGFTKMRVVDRDKIEAHNVGTQLFGESEIGLRKVEALRNRLFRACGVEIEAIAKELNERNARSILMDTHLIVDVFDNSRSRRVVQEHSRATSVPCLHVGLFADYAEIIWDEHYRVPNDGVGDICDYPLARNVILLATAVASETIVRYAIDASRNNWSITLRDLAIRAAAPFP